ncbi:RNA-binding protein 7 isoform X2 [Salarias fasciatus]|uniref:RNA-binding protein 7 isoform X2 n=1 Tax=Salarias fasciatus TaxID=181472 RepID=UPI001176E1FD|nr:RNA-binding protein 7-like isoform X2 [Salarias fasciatus]
MGIEEEAERTLFIRNLDTRVSEELLFELFLQAGPVIRTKIPKDPDGKQKTFGFVIYKHEESVPYAMQLLNGSSLFGKNIHVLFRQGSSHNSSPANSNKPSPANTPDPHGQRTSAQFSSPQYTPPAQMQTPFSSFDNMHKQIMVHMQQLEQLNGGVSKPAGGRTGARQHDSAPYRHHSSPNSSRGQRYGGDEPGSGRQGRDGYHHHHHHHHHSDRSGGRHYDNRGGNRQYDERGGNRGYQEKWRRY